MFSQSDLQTAEHQRILSCVTGYGWVCNKNVHCTGCFCSLGFAAVRLKDLASSELIFSSNYWVTFCVRCLARRGSSNYAAYSHCHGNNDDSIGNAPILSSRIDITSSRLQYKLDQNMSSIELFFLCVLVAFGWIARQIWPWFRGGSWLSSLIVWSSFAFYVGVDNICRHLAVLNLQIADGIWYLPFITYPLLRICILSLI